MKKVIISVILLLLLCSCTENQSETSQKSENTGEQSASFSSEVPKRDEIKTNLSSVSLPLSAGEWGICAKYVISQRQYADIPVRITSFERGEKAENLVKKLMSENKGNPYRELPEDFEWVVAYYEISLDSFPVDEGGADASLSAMIISENGEMPEYSSKILGTVANTFYDKNYAFEGILKGVIVYQMPKNDKEYLLAVGEYEETQAFFRE